MPANVLAWYICCTSIFDDILALRYYILYFPLIICHTNLTDCHAKKTPFFSCIESSRYKKSFGWNWKQPIKQQQNWGSYNRRRFSIWLKQWWQKSFSPRYWICKHRFFNDHSFLYLFRLPSPVVISYLYNLYCWMSWNVALGSEFNRAVPSIVYE